MKVTHTVSALALVSHALAVGPLPVGKAAALSLASAFLSRAFTVYALPAERRSEEDANGGVLGGLLAGGPTGDKGLGGAAPPPPVQEGQAADPAAAQPPVDLAAMDAVTLHAVMQMVAKLGHVDPAICAAAPPPAAEAAMPPPPPELNVETAVEDVATVTGDAASATETLAADATAADVAAEVIATDAAELVATATDNASATATDVAAVETGIAGEGEGEVAMGEATLGDAAMGDAANDSNEKRGKTRRWAFSA